MNVDYADVLHMIGKYFLTTNFSKSINDTRLFYTKRCFEKILTKCSANIKVPESEVNVYIMLKVYSASYIFGG